MKRIMMLCLLGALAGCVQHEVETTHVSPRDTPAKLADAQKRAKIHTDLGASYYERGQMGVALDELKEALRADPNYAPAYYVMGLVYMELREDGEAERNFRRSLEIDPLDPKANNNYGWFLCQRKQEDQSIKYFMAALKNPLYATPEIAYANAGICMRQKGDEKAAEEYFLKALRIRPDQTQALYNMADLSYKRGQYTEARAYLIKFQQVAPPTAESLWLGVRTERKLGNRDAEVNYAMQLRRRYPESKETRALKNGQFE